MADLGLTLLLLLLFLVPMLSRLLRTRVSRQSHSEERGPCIPSLPVATDEKHHEEQLRNIYHVAFLLRQKLVADVVPPILRYARLFAEQSTSKSFLGGRGLQVDEYNSPRYLFASQAIRCNARTQCPVREVVFEIESHDQGWADDESASWTWFAAEISRPTDGNRETSGRRDVVRNIVAHPYFVRHRVEWRADSEDEEAAAWVKSLRVGDSINVMAMAQFPGWENHVRYVNVSIYTVGVT